MYKSIIIFLFMIGVSMSEENAEIEWGEKVSLIEKRYDLKQKENYSIFLKELQQEFKRLSRRGKINVLSNEANQTTRFFNEICRWTLRAAIANDDAVLLQLALESGYIQSVEGVGVVRYISESKDGVYFPVILSAFISSEREDVKNCLLMRMKSFYVKEENVSDIDFLKLAVIKHRKNEGNLPSLVLDGVKKNSFLADPE